MISGGYPMLVVAPVSGLAVYCASHIVLSRLQHATKPYISLIGGFVLGLLAVAALSVAALARMEASVQDSVGLLSLNAMGYLAFAFGYFNFVNLNIASLRIRAVQELWLAGGAMEKERLRSMHSTESVIALRLERLTRGGHLVEKEGRFHIGKSRFLLVGRLFDFLRRLILGSTRVADSLPRDPAVPTDPQSARGCHDATDS